VAIGDLAGMGGAGLKTFAQLRCTRAAGLNFSTGNRNRLWRRTPKPLQSAPPALRQAGHRASRERIALLARLCARVLATQEAEVIGREDGALLSCQVAAWLDC